MHSTRQALHLERHSPTAGAANTTTLYFSKENTLVSARHRCVAEVEPVLWTFSVSRRRERCNSIRQQSVLYRIVPHLLGRGGLSVRPGSIAFRDPFGGLKDLHLIRSDPGRDATLALPTLQDVAGCWPFRNSDHRGQAQLSARQGCCYAVRSWQPPAVMLCCLLPGLWASHSTIGLLLLPTFPCACCVANALLGRF